jgi:integrase
MQNLIIAEEPKGPELTGLTPAVGSRHRRALRCAKEELSHPRYHALPLVGALLAWIKERAAQRLWSAATLHRELCNLHGAWGKLPAYTNSPERFSLTDDVTFAGALRAASQAANEEQARQQPACATPQMSSAIAAAPDVPTKAALMLTWVCGGRVGDTLKLTANDVALDPSFATTGHMKVLFARGKGALLGSPYTVPTVCPLEWRGVLSAFLRGFSPEQSLFPGGYDSHGPAVSAALRSVDPSFTARAIRRGALQAMALQGVPLETIMVFSGHKRQATCLRYLGWGNTAEGIARQARAAAAHLAPAQPARQL